MSHGGHETSCNSSVEDYGETLILTVVHYEETSRGAKTQVAVLSKRYDSRIGFYKFLGSQVVE